MNDQQIVHVLRMAADTLQKVINRNQRLDQEINQLKGKYQKDVEQIRKIADELIRKYNGTTDIEEKKAAIDEARKTAEAIMQVKPAPVRLTPPIPRVMPYTPLATIRGLKPRTYSAFKKLNARTVADLATVTRSQLLRLDNVGEKTVAEVRQVMERIGYKMRDR